MTDSDAPPGEAAWFGDRAVVVPLSSPTQRAAVSQVLGRRLPHCRVRAGMQSVLVEAIDPDAHLLGAVTAALRDGRLADVGADPAGRHVCVPVAYSGVDLEAVAAALSISAAALVAAHQGQRWTVAMMGFAPGFGYLVPAGEPLLDWGALARRDRPRERVPAGSVAVAAGMSAVYPATMPGGWHLIGLTRAAVFDASVASDPALLHPGDTVTFVEEQT